MTHLGKSIPHVEPVVTAERRVCEILIYKSQRRGELMDILRL